MNLRALIQPSLLLIAALLGNGCTTSALWEEGRFAHYREPDQPPRLRLFHSARADDVLVQYREVCEDTEKTHRRAFWLNPNLSRIQERKKPYFVSPREARKLSEIPVLAATGDAAAGTQLYAIASTNGLWDFALYSQTGSLGNYQLPVYRDASGRVKQVLLTPLTVAADATIIGGVLALWIAPGFADPPYYEGNYR